MSLTTWIIIFGLILINALYVAAEFSTVSARRSRIQQRAEAGNALARRLLPVLSDPHALDRYIAACQIGITLSSLVLGAYGQATLAVALAPVFEQLGQMQVAAAQSTAAIVVLAGLTVLQMVLGELVPKSLALQYPTQTALWTVLPMQWSLRLLAWFIVVLNGSGIALLRLFRAHEGGHRHIHSPEEIELLIAESRDGGLLEPDEHRRLQQALRLGVSPAREFMVPRLRIRAIDVESSSAEVLHEVTESPFTRIPVYEDSVDRIVGIVHTRDVAAAALGHSGTFSLRTLMRPVLIVPQSMKTDRLLVRMREERQHTAIVADEFGGTAGLITVDDILGELLGDVADEFKVAASTPERLADGRVRLPGDLRLDMAEAWIGLQWDGGAATVAGRVLETLGHVPVAGEQVVIDGVRVEVESVNHHAITAVLATPIVKQKEAPHG